ncbi:MAG: hypothetical protein GF421_07315 [Candidatus Aminicenantes bacterium]|nr:hypothetical protein [Candidatus Aminicenantes bacterium]
MPSKTKRRKTMKCTHIEPYLSPYLEKELRPEKMSQIENHIKTCPDCAELLSNIKEARAALAGIPEIEISRSLKKTLYKIPRKRFKLSFDFLFKPALQPILAAATVMITVITLYSMNPEREQINKTINQHIHMGYSKIERLYARAESLTNTLAGYKESVLFSIKNIDFFWEKND